MEWVDVLQLSLMGISQGCGYALVAIGFVFIYRATEIVNFAHGELMMLGANLMRAPSGRAMIAVHESETSAAASLSTFTTPRSSPFSSAPRSPIGCLSAVPLNPSEKNYA